MKAWGIIVAVLYVVMLVALSGPLAGTLLFEIKNANPDWSGFMTSLSSIYSSYGTKDGWLFLAVALIAQAALLTVPVELAAKRPVTKRTIVPLVLATSFTTALLIAGAVLAVEEVFKDESLLRRGWVAGGLFFLVWSVWAAIFSQWSKKGAPKSFVERQCQWLFKGSILELLIAVPAHIFVRQRHECCAGFQTGMGIAFGIAVMLFSFGPGVFFLYANRWNKKRRSKD